MINAGYARKLVAEELRDTLFFATGEYATKEKGTNTITLSVPKFATVVIHNHRKIYVNGDLCKSTPEARWELQTILNGGQI
jgi:hypothetical protein